MAGFAAIAAWIALALVPRRAGPVALGVADLQRELPRLTRAGAVTGVQLRIDSLPDAAATAWLTALRRAGVDVGWRGDLAPLAVEVFRSAAPSSDLVVLASSPGQAILRDELGALDTLDGGGAVRLAAAEGGLTLTAGPQAARTHQDPAAGGGEPRAIYVAGAAGWEAKFVIAALEEAGWEVDARLSVAPGKDVVQGRARPVDTATHAAVLLLDSASAETVRGVESFVRSGGGVVIAGSANRAGRVKPLLGWRAAQRETAPLGVAPGDTSWRGLSRIPLVLASSPRALGIEQRAGRATVAARRHHAGRVAAVGYDETWRWRMAGGPNSVADHRSWWSGIVASVAARSSGESRGAAPAAAIHEALDAPAGDLVVPVGNAAARAALANLLGFLALGALTAEWLSRRARGAR